MAQCCTWVWLLWLPSAPGHAHALVCPQGMTRRPGLRGGGQPDLAVLRRVHAATARAAGTAIRARPELRLAAAAAAALLQRGLDGACEGLGLRAVPQQAGAALGAQAGLAAAQAEAAGGVTQVL